MSTRSSSTDFDQSLNCTDRSSAPLNFNVPVDQSENKNNCSQN